MLDRNLVAEVLDVARSGGATFAELFMEDTVTTNLHLLGGNVKDAGSGNLYGAGLRLLYGTKVVYAYTNDCTPDGLMEVARTLARAQGSTGEVDARGAGGLDFRRLDAKPLWTIRDHPTGVSKREKLEIARRAHGAAQGEHVRTTDVMYLDVAQRILVANTEGDWSEDERVRSRLYVTVVADDGTRRSTGMSGPGAAMGREFFDGDLPERTGAEAKRIALAMLPAGYAPAGKMPVVIGNAFGGVIFHEACGHILETTAVAKKASVFADKLGERIANECVSAVDDGTIPGAWGSINVDDEATPSERTVLIEKGVLKSFMVDRLGELQTGYRRTGSGRRQDYTFAPTSRMRNTFILEGERTPEELIADVKFGLYARTMGGGSVTPGTGDYNFTVNEGYLIRDGEICEPVRGAALVGNGAQDLMNIVGVANDLDRGQGMCGSQSGSIPTDVGQPHILISEITVGGRA
ncbi:TldD/PmbA family protein [Deinococcus pimensis]|uniref:TldD/PmbA family protein n=1 Tax=Deinococcus pimensis TaxID=309888 RepID=UPI00048A32D8|nr:TldD/PmbA family protein [Deinococcus pimensis]